MFSTNHQSVFHQNYGYVCNEKCKDDETVNGWG